VVTCARSAARYKIPFITTGQASASTHIFKATFLKPTLKS
jgi:hypothetical protein